MQEIKILIVLILFLPILFKIFKEKKWYLYLYCSFVGVLPDTFAIELSKSLPLITGERLIILLLLAAYILKRPSCKLCIQKDLFFFITISLLVACINLRYGMQEINHMLIIILEILAPLVAIPFFISNDNEIEKCIIFSTYSSIVLSVFAISQTILNFDLSTVFEIVDARSYAGITNRMELVRAHATMGAIQYGCYCAIFCTLSLLWYRERREKIFLLGFIANMIGLCLSMSRSSMIPVAVFLILIFRQNIRRYSKIIILGMPICIVGFFTIVILNPNVLNIAKNLFYSIIAVFGADVTISSEFGLNAHNASGSRLMQFTSAYYMLMHGGFIFGYGYQATLREAVHVFDPVWRAWRIFTALDVGLSGVFIEGGLVGFINYSAFFLRIFKNAKNSKNFFMDSFKYILALYFILNITSSCVSISIVWTMIALYYAKNKIDTKETENNNDRCICDYSQL